MAALRFGVVRESVADGREWLDFARRAETVWQMPTIFIGSAEQIRSDLLERRDRRGLSYLVAGDGALPALAEIIGG
ncbi:MAG: hypothetical protein WB688_06525, partial [Trebonia sp.]